MQTQPRLEGPKEPNGVNRKRLAAVLTRYEAAVAENADGVFDDADTIAKELEESRAAVLDLLQDCKMIIENPNSTRWEFVVGKKLKDLATAMMRNRDVTREVARQRIMQALDIMIAREFPALTPHVQTTMCSADIGKVSPVLLDHLPEGSH